MKIICALLILTLLLRYGTAFSKLRHERLPLSPIPGWMVGLGCSLVIPLTVLVLNGGYTIPAFYDAKLPPSRP
jgi:hypothetical protein